jgi:hypothetical protein
MPICNTKCPEKIMSIGKDAQQSKRTFVPLFKRTVSTSKEVWLCPVAFIEESFRPGGSFAVVIISKPGHVASDKEATAFCREVPQSARRITRRTIFSDITRVSFKAPASVDGSKGSLINTANILAPVVHY